MALEFRKKETYMSLIKNAPGSKLFRDVVFFNNSDSDFEGIPAGTSINITKNGQLSCPYFVSALLHLLGGVIDAPHVTVEGTIRAMLARGWQQLRSNDEIYPGDVVIWEKNPAGNTAHYAEGHTHIGFILDKNTAVSTSGKLAEVMAHDPYFRNMGEGITERKIDKIFAHPDLSDRPELQFRKSS